MTHDPLIERLASELTPVRPRRPAMEGLLLGLICAVELALLLLLGAGRPDMPPALPMGRMSFWWKLLSLATIAVVGSIGAILSFNPARSARPALRRLAAVIGVALAAGWLLDAAHGGLTPLAARLNWPAGVQCAGKMALLSVPPVIGLAILMRRGAAADARASALVCGLAASAWGALIFAFACPYDDPLYIAVWYCVGCGAVTLLARLVLPVIARW